MTDRPEYTLLGSDDAMLWAEEFCRIFNGHMITADSFNPTTNQPGPVDPGTMVSWFANAMQTAVNFYERRKLHEKGELTETEQFLKTWDEEHPDEEQDPTGEVSLEESFVEGFNEGRVEPPT